MTQTHARTTDAGSIGWTVAARRWLDRTWWPIWPVFTWLIGELTLERTCGAGSGLVAGLSVRPLPAAALAAIYVAAHAWLGVAVLVTTTGAGEMVPGAKAIVRVWQRWPVKLVLMAVVFAVDYLPRTIFRLAASAICRS